VAPTTWQVKVSNVFKAAFTNTGAFRNITNESFSPSCLPLGRSCFPRLAEFQGHAAEFK